MFIILGPGTSKWVTWWIINIDVFAIITFFVCHIIIHQTSILDHQKKIFSETPPNFSFLAMSLIKHRIIIIKKVLYFFPLIYIQVYLKMYIVLTHDFFFHFSGR